MRQLSPLPDFAPAPVQPALASVLLGPSAAITQLWIQLRRLAPHARCVLLTGEVDCGQEAIARSFLELSAQRTRPFLVLSAAQADLQLTRGPGLSSVPADAFLFLPDIHNFGLAAQAGILALIRMRRSRPFTVVAATGEDLRALTSTGRFLPELAHALSAVRLAVPALRDRKEDLPLLLTELLNREGARDLRPAPAMGRTFVEAALRHTWPGNLRELVQVATVLAQSSCTELEADDLAAGLQVVARSTPEVAAAASRAPVRMVSLDTVVQEHIAAVLHGCRGNKLRAAEVLGISRSTLYRMLEASVVPPVPLPPLKEVYC